MTEEHEEWETLFSSKDFQDLWICMNVMNMQIWKRLHVANKSSGSEFQLHRLLIKPAEV